MNFFAAVDLTPLLLIRKSEAGRIVNLSSILASLTPHAAEGPRYITSKMFAYDASKAALNSFTIRLLHELRGTRIKVNSAHPEWDETDFGGAGATMGIENGGRTSVELALYDQDGATAKRVN